MNLNFFINHEAIGHNTKDIFLNDFDITWAEGKTNNKILTKLPIEKIKDDQDDGSIKYVYNDDFFRCDNFKKDHDGIHILFAGCSQTEGVGGNIEDTWAYSLYNNLKNNNNVSGFYSIAKAGYGWQKVISNFLIYCNKYKKPDFLFILLPNVGRFYEWDIKYSQWFYKQKYLEILFNDDEKTENNFINKKQYFELLINFKISWNLFENFCKDNNIKMLWSTWDELDHINYLTMGIENNYIPMADKNKIELYVKDYIKTNKIKPGDTEKRDGHYGNIYHKYWYNGFNKEIKRRWELK